MVGDGGDGGRWWVMVCDGRRWCVMVGDGGDGGSLAFAMLHK